MDYGDWYTGKPRRSGSFFGYLAMGLLGVICGALLVYALFNFYIIPELTAPAPPGADDSPRVETPLPHRDDLPTVEVVNRIMPAVVGVNNYAYVSRFGQRTLVEAGSGSGVIVSSDGYIITNQHVIDGADEIRVVLPENSTVVAELVGEDVLTDLALLKIERTDLPFVPLGDSTAVRVGESVLAAGNPLGYFQQTVTAGIISAVERQVRIPDSQYAYTFIQTDAVINPGNSGGPLVNMHGEIIGINSAKVSRLGVEGIGLAIPSRTVKRVMDDLRSHGKVRRPQLGVLVEDLFQLTGDIADQGVHIREVIAGSPADRSGLQAGDVIIAIDNKQVRYLAQLFDALLEYYPEEEIVVTVKRDDAEQRFSVILGEMQ